MVGFALELDRADKTPAGPGVEPAFDQRQEPRRIAHDIREQPIDRPDRARVEGEGALAAVLDAGEPRHLGRERRLVDADHPRTDLRQGPAPAARAAAEVEANL